jgi:hypothetical protein
MVHCISRYSYDVHIAIHMVRHMEYNLRYGNIIKQALHDIENVKRQIMGDDARIKVLDQSIRQGIVKLSDHDRTILKPQ